MPKVRLPIRRIYKTMTDFFRVSTIYLKLMPEKKHEQDANALILLNSL